VVLTAEGLRGERKHMGANGDDVTSETRGGYSFLQVQLARRWFAAGRADYLETPDETAEDVKHITRRGSAILVYAPTEFSAIRLQGSRIFPEGGADPVNEAFLQMNFTLGAHPAHAY
jgi:hypothetical protein